MGGTFMSLPDDYRDYFIRNLHDALSGHSSISVEEAVKYSERSKTKCIGITIETRPDYCLKRHLRYSILSDKSFCIGFLFYFFTLSCALYSMNIKNKIINKLFSG